MSNRNKKISGMVLPLTAVLLLAAGACNKYLNVQPKGYTLLTSASDYDQWLNNVALTSDPAVPAINLMADNVDNPLIKPGTTAAADLIYLWSAQFELDLTLSPPIWPQHYASINYFNTVINGIGSATGGTAQQLRSLRAEALLGRAFEYLYLVNLYGKEYDSTSAGSDLSVPFVTANDVTSPAPGRGTVQAVYDHIISDLTEAIPDLPASNSVDRYRGSVAAAYSVLARACLYKRDYAGAEKNAQAALNSDPSLSLIDYNITGYAQLPHPATSPEAIYARNAGYDFDPAFSTNPAIYPSQPFLLSFDTTDLRLPYFYRVLKQVVIVGNIGTQTFPLTPPYDFPQRGVIQYAYTSNAPNSTNTYYVNSGTSVPEMKLIVAEGAARSGDLATALQQLNEVRKVRFPAASFVPVQSTSSDTVLQKVLAERNFELPFVGIRWFDMRRLNAEGRMPSISRNNGGDTVLATLAPSSPRYTLQIPGNVLTFNPGMPQNP
jgi:starch-binding outer membrane protein, SusD/RagB family